MIVLISTIILLTIDLYILVIGLFTVGWFRQKEQITNVETRPINSFSVIIPFKNELKNLPHLLGDLLKLNYPKSLFEIILIDDDSIDKSVLMVNNFISENGLSWKSISSSGGKKKALEIGVENAVNKYIITLDADCRIPPMLIKAYDEALQIKATKMIAGPVTFYSDDSLWGQLLELEFISLIGSGAGSINIGKPIMLNAANMLFERELALEANSVVYQSKIASGDDIFLMHYLLEHYDANELQFLKSKLAIVRTAAPKNIKEWVKQRLRWTAKARNYKINFTSITAIIILTFNMVFMASFFLVFLPKYANIFFYIYIAKTLIDLPILYSTAKFLGQTNRLILMPLLQIFYPFYIAIIGVLGLFSKEGWRK